MVIDFHSHMLPKMDDGASDVKTSLKMLHTAASQGVEVQLFTPHFYPWNEDMESFLSRRDESCRLLAPYFQRSWPRVLLGAEVAFFPNMSETKLDGMCIGNSKVLLLEMPFKSWDRSVNEELAELTLGCEYHVVLAHVERYIRFKNNWDTLMEIAELPVTFQMNAEAFLEFPARFRSEALAKELGSFVLGSDAHGSEQRVPNLREGRESIKKHLGAFTLDEIDRTSEELFREIVDV